MDVVKYTKKLFSGEDECWLTSTDSTKHIAAYLLVISAFKDVHLDAH
mgnify:FL=1